MAGCDSLKMLYRYAVFAAICSLLIIISGAIVTSRQPVPPATPEALADSRVASQVVETDQLQQVHRIAAFAMTTLMLGLAVWLSIAKTSRTLRCVAWSAAALLILEVGLGEVAAHGRMSASAAFSHAYLAQIYFTLAVVIALFTSPSWSRDRELVDDRFSLRAMSLYVPILLLLQIALGAAYRHQAMGVLWHIFGAFVVAIFVLLVGVLTVKQYPAHSTLRSAAIWLMSIAGAQVLLGFTAFVMRLLTNQPTLPVVIVTTAHVATGALTLAAGFVLTIQIRRHVRATAAALAEPSTQTGRP